MGDVKLTMEDGTVINIGNSAIITSKGVNLNINDSGVTISRDPLCKDCGHPMTIFTEMKPGEPIKYNALCGKCNPESALKEIGPLKQIKPIEDGRP